MFKRPHVSGMQPEAHLPTGLCPNRFLRQYPGAGLSDGRAGVIGQSARGVVRVAPVYREGGWSFGPERSRLDGLPRATTSLQFHKYGDAEKGYVITAIIKDGNIAYNLPPENFALKAEYDPDGKLLSQRYVYTGEQIYLHDQTYKITPTAGGWLWQEKSGDWKRYDGDGRLASFGDRHGTTATILYDASGKVTGYADRAGTQVIWVDYNSEGRITAVRDAQGTRVEYTSNPDGRLATVKDGSGQETTYQYDESGRLAKVSKPGGEESNLTYDASGSVAAVRDQEGKGSAFGYGYDKGKKEYSAQIIMPDGRVKEVWYDEQGDTKRVDLDGTTVQTIRKDGNALIITDESGLATRKEYDEWDNLTREVSPDGTENTYQYEHTYQQLVRKTERGVVTEYTYDPDGKLTTLVEAKGTETERVTDYTYNADGNRTNMRLTEAVGSGLQRVTIEDYDDNGNRTRLVEAAGSDLERVTEYTYDLDGNLTRITKYLDGGATAVTEMRYTADGNLEWQRDPSGQETAYTYEDAKIKTVTTSQGTWTYGYTDGRLTSVTDPFGQTREQTYNADGQVETVKVNGQTVATYTYQNGQLTQRTDAMGNVSQFEYNADGQLTQQRDPENREQRYEYDTQGRLWKTIDGNNNEIFREYGPTGATSSGSSCPSCSGNRLLGGARGGSERLQKISYPTFTKEFRYDADGRVSEEI